MVYRHNFTHYIRLLFVECRKLFFTYSQFLVLYYICIFWKKKRKGSFRCAYPAKYFCSAQEEAYSYIKIYTHIPLSTFKCFKWQNVLFFSPESLPGQYDNFSQTLAQVCVFFFLDRIALKLAMVTLILLYNVQRIASHQEHYMQKKKSLLDIPRNLEVCTSQKNTRTASH